MDKDKMLKWAALLDKVPAENFDMGSWGVSSERINGPVCATKACALGWATAIPEFNEAGLELRGYHGNRHAGVYFKDYCGHRAASAFFGISDSQAHRLCYTGTDDPKRKARQIRRMVSSEKSPLK